ncbi:8454_t:CDS:2 [Funneliformis geosporum]|uniref:8454_t:CDS:1 n=1 Tax=Funneliformis geosporum TaxID=1117311 RepID=A0A9W4WHI7_9GLOM|nr:8454_t:CDS:2 [Funneliformis geosporum]
MSNSATPTNSTSENNTPQQTTPIRSPHSNQSHHSSIPSSPRQQSSNHGNEINKYVSEQNSPLSELVDTDSASDNEIVRRKRVKRHAVESPTHDSSRTRSLKSSSITPTALSPKNQDAISELFSEKHLTKKSPWEITDEDTKNDNSGNEDIDLFGGAVSDDEGQFEHLHKDAPMSDDEGYTRPRSFNTGNYELVYAKPPGSCDGKYYIAKLPNFFTYCTQAYAPESYTEEDDYKHGNTIRLGAENTIRWRYKRNEMVKESNTKMIKWSDGTMSLLIGEEMFLINSHDISKQHTFLGVPNVHSNSIENHARLTNQVTFRPDPNSRTHKRLSAAIQARNVKQVKTKFVDINDPKLIELQLQSEREKKPRTEKRTTVASKSRSRKRSFDEYSDPDEPSYMLYRRNDSYEDDTGFVVADENDSDDEYNRPEKRRKGKERATESRRKRDLTPVESSLRLRKRHLDESKEENLDEYGDNGQEEHLEEGDGDMSLDKLPKRVKEDVEEIDADIDIDESLLHDHDEEEEDMPVVKKGRRSNRMIIEDD